MEPVGSGPAFAGGQAEEGPEGAAGACGSCGRALPPPDLEGVAAAIDQTLSLEAGRMVPRTAWAGRAPDGAMDALFAWLPSVKARRQLWERGQLLWTEQMTAALSGPCEDCQGAAGMPPEATVIQSPPGAQPEPRYEQTSQPSTAPQPYDSSTVVMPSGGSFPDAPTAYEPPSPSEGQTTAMPAYSDPSSTIAMPAGDAKTSMASFASSFGGPPPAAEPTSEASPPEAVSDSDEHESHTVILSAMPSLRTTTRLVVLEGPVHGRQFSLGRQLTTIGRSIGCHVTVDADGVAYDHARVVRAGEGWQIERVGGADDLFVNDEPVRDTRTLRDGDVIRIGPARLRFESAS